MSMWEADQVYGGAVAGEACEIKDVVLGEDKDANPTLFLYIEVGHKANNPRNPTDPSGHEPIHPGQEEIRLFLGQDDDEKSTKRRQIALDQISAILGERLADAPETLLKFIGDGKDSVVPNLVGKKVWLKANESSGKVYLNLHIQRPKAVGMSMKDLRAKIAARRKLKEGT